MKIILGTANFSQDYGFQKKSIKSTNKIHKILSYCKKNKIKFLDTAFSYIKEKKILMKIEKSGLAIITKFSLNDLSIDSKNIDDFSKKLTSNLNIINTKNIYAVLLHNYKDLENKDYRSKILKALKILKKKKKIKKIGVSVYEPSDLSKILKFWTPDIVQVPINPLNHSFLKNNFLMKLKKKKIEIHARSIFLQGVLIMRYSDIPLNLKKKKSIKKWNKWCTENKINKLEALISFIKKIKEVDKVVIGVDSLINLKQVSNAFNMKEQNGYNYNKLKISKSEDLRKW